MKFDIKHVKFGYFVVKNIHIFIFLWYNSLMLIFTQIFGGSCIHILRLGTWKSGLNLS